MYVAVFSGPARHSMACSTWERLGATLHGLYITIMSSQPYCSTLLALTHLNALHSSQLLLTMTTHAKTGRKQRMVCM